MAFLPYHQALVAPGIIPSWHAGPNGIAENAARGVLIDGLLEGARQSLACRFISRAPEDALALHGEARRFPRAPGESLDEYRARLRRAWYLWQWAGTETGIKAAFALLGLTNVSVFESNITPGWGRHSGDLNRARWFQIVVRAPHPFGADFSFSFGDGTVWGGGKLWGVNGDPRLLELLRRLVRLLKPATAHCEWIALVLSGDVKVAGGLDDGDPTPGSKVAYLVP
jgi:hypothetical protein